MIVVTGRDKEIKEFLEVVQIADTKTLHTLFFPNTTIRNCQKRLKQLVEYKFIKVYRENMLEQNVYYAKNKPTNIKHKIVFSQLIARLKQDNIEVIKYVTPFKIGDIIADGLIVIKLNDEVKIYFVEVERTKKLNVKKYEELHYSRKYKDKFPLMPSILCITDKKTNTDHNVLNIITCKMDFSNFSLQ